MKENITKTQTKTQTLARIQYKVFHLYEYIVCQTYHIIILLPYLLFIFIFFQTPPVFAVYNQC